MSAGALRMKRSRPRSTTARSSSCPSTGTKSGMRSIGKKRYAPIPARMSFCCAGTRPSRRSAQTRRMYVGRRRIRSTTSAMSFGARMRLATLDISLREACPQSRDGAGKRRIAVRRPKRHEIPRLPVRDASQLDRGRRCNRHSFGLREGRADVFSRNRLLIGGQHEPGGGAARRKAREVHDRSDHECPIRNDELTTIVRAELRRPKRDLVDGADVTGDLDGVADPERSLDEDPHSREEVLQDVLERESDHETDDAERRQDPAERVSRVYGEDPEPREDDDSELREIAKEHRDVGLRAIACQCPHRHSPDGTRDEECDRGNDQRPKRSGAVIENVVPDRVWVEGHPAENTSALDN